LLEDTASETVKSKHKPKKSHDDTLHNFHPLTFFYRSINLLLSDTARRQHNIRAKIQTDSLRHSPRSFCLDLCSAKGACDRLRVDLEIESCHLCSQLDRLYAQFTFISSKLFFLRLRVLALNYFHFLPLLPRRNLMDASSHL